MQYLADNVERLISSGDVVPIIAIGGGLLVAIVAIVFGSMKSICVARAREETKRELAAYVAEGSLDPDKAVALMNAGRAKWEVGKCNADDVA